MKYEKYYSKNSYIISRYLIFECFGIFGIYMVKITKALFAIFLSLLLFSCKSETNYEKGLQAFNNYNYEEAITYLENSLIEDNGINKEDINIILSKAYINLGKYIEAIEILDGIDGNKTNEFIDELLKGYDLINEDGINHKTVKICVDKNPGYITGLNLEGYIIESTHLQGPHPVSEYHQYLMVLEIDNTGDNHKFLTSYYNEKELYDTFGHVNESLGVSLNYQNGELDTFTVSEGSFDCVWETDIYTRTYDSDFKIQKYANETYYPIEVDNHNILEEEFIYYENGALEKYTYNRKCFVTDREICEIMDHFLLGDDLDINIDDIKNRQSYVNEYTRIRTYTKDERFLKEEYYEFDILKREVVATYDENNRVINYAANNYEGYNNGYEQPFEWSYEYNDDGYLVKEEIIRRDVFYPEGYYATYEYSEDYTTVTKTEHCPTYPEVDGNSQTLYRHPDGYYYYEEYIPNE